MQEFTVTFVSGCRRALEELVAGKVLIAHIVAKYVEWNEVQYNSVNVDILFDAEYLGICCTFTCLLVMVTKESTLIKPLYSKELSQDPRG